MAENIRNQQKDLDSKPGLSQMVDEMVTSAKKRRSKHEQRWYDNNFFDDGFHFRYVSRQTGKIVDLSQKDNYNFPIRAIPKASRQIRGITNLLMQPEYVPTIFPERVSITDFSTTEAYLEAQKLSTFAAESIGKWIEDEWDEGNLKTKLTDMVIKAQRNSVAYLQVYVDSEKEKIKTKVFDAFDIYLYGEHTDIEDCPFVIKTVPVRIEELVTNTSFDRKQVLKVIEDNKYSSSDVKEAYMQSRYGSKTDVDISNTALLSEAFIKTYLTSDNMGEIGSSFPDAIEGKEKGDIVMRHVFVANGVWLKDEYLDMCSYPFVSFTMEPGPLYQTPQIERFIPANKSLDIVMSRLERYMNTMVSGSWLVRKGENVHVTNIPGGQKLEYETTPPVQANIANVPAGMMDLIELLERNIEEQGASVAALGQLPQGVKSGVAIEEVKATEFTNLKVAYDQLKETVERIGEKMIEVAADYFLSPKGVAIMEDEGPSYFTIIGERGARLRNQIGEELPQDTVVIKRNIPINVEVDTGIAFTPEGKRNVMQQIATFMIELSKVGLLNPESVKVVLGKFLDTFKFGATREFMEVLDEKGLQQTLDQNNVDQIKVAVAEVIKDLGLAGADAEQRQIDATKLGMAETITDLQG